MSDLIDRQHAIDEIRFYITEPDISDDETKIEGYNDGLEMAISILSILSSAEPEMITIEEVSNQLGCATIQSALYWFEFLKTLDSLGFAIVRKKTR